MTVRYIVRPPAIKRTPKRLAGLLQARRTAPYNGPTQFDWHKDLFLAYPPRNKVDNADSNYDSIHSFFTSNKAQQRILLHNAGVPIVPTFYGREYYGDEAYRAGPYGYITRPLHHRSGQGYTHTVAPPVADGTHYTSPCLPKIKEFRVIYYRGKRVSTYFKSNPNNISYTQPWNFTNGCVFHTITRDINDLLSNTGLYGKLADCPAIKHSSLCAVDILVVDPNKPFVSEVNLCPGLSVPRTLQAIKGIEDERSVS